MLCPSCHGRRLIDLGGVFVPCQDCGGMGEIHCCEGLVAQPGEPEPVCIGRSEPPRSGAIAVVKQ